MRGVGWRGEESRTGQNCMNNKEEAPTQNLIKIASSVSAIPVQCTC
jgi:hypothetical protein